MSELHQGSLRGGFRVPFKGTRRVPFKGSIGFRVWGLGLYGLGFTGSGLGG